jgi:hypothetical protein
MKEELDNYLCVTYPKMFVNRHASMQETCMCWGFACGDGWFQILRTLCQNIQHHIDWSVKNNQWDLDYNQMIVEHNAGDSTKLNKFCGDGPWGEDRKEEILESGIKKVRPIIPQVVVEQVKEKFGTLRFYYQGGDDEIYGMVRMAESMSGVMCEECGAPGTSNSDGWVRTLCEQHEAEYQQRRNSNE